MQLLMPIKKVRNDIKFRFNRVMRSPFTRNDQKLILHCCHHKMGTSWFTKIYSFLAEYYGLHFQKSILREELKDSTDIYLQGNSDIDFSKLPDYRGSHIIRDPRDIVVSRYFYHLWAREKWLHIPRRDRNNLTYQEHLKSLDREEGINYEIETLSSRSKDFKNMLNWDYHNPNFIEIKYEELISNEELWFRKIFSHYRFSKSGIEIALGIAEKCSIKNTSKKNIGRGKHIRSGKTSQWKDIFTEKNKLYFKEKLGDSLIKLGYEDNYNW